MFLKIHHLPGSADVVAVCDRELLNTTISHEKLTVTVHDSFYGTTPASEEEVRSALEKAGNINLIGERAVNVAISMGLVNNSDCIMIGKVPHTQIYRV
ncbi:MAG: DUF424 domain-containing protein [Methanoregula sp.]|nr:DUF424 domain-containing protein [Methanoregula sp.]